LSKRTVLRGGGHERAALSLADSLGRRPEGVVRSRLDLHHDELRASPADQVQLAAAGPETGPDHLIAAPLEEVGGRLLAGAAQL
jgi:hypothetical protein